MKKNLPHAHFSTTTSLPPVAEIPVTAIPHATKTPAVKKAERLHYMDWLRVIAFSILIAFHSAEVFAEWKWWINNNERSETISYILLFIKQWRMPLLFVISGAAVHLTLRRRQPLNFIHERIMRLLIPLIAGMFLIIPPQIYYINKLKGYPSSIAEHYTSLAGLQWFPQGSFHWLHLWFLAFIFVFSLLIIPLIQWLKTDKGEKTCEYLITLIKHPPVLFSLMLLMQTPHFMIESVLPGSNISSLSLYFPYFLFGALFSTNIRIRQALKINAGKALKLAMLTTACLYLFFWITDSEGNALIPLHLNKPAFNTLLIFLKTANQWFWLIAIFGLAIRYLNFGNRVLTYANQAVYPFYIFHQTIIIIFGYYIIQTPAGIAGKFFMILGFTFLFILFLYEAVLKRSRITKLLFGIKIAPPGKVLSQSVE